MPYFKIFLAVVAAVLAQGVISSPLVCIQGDPVAGSALLTLPPAADNVQEDVRFSFDRKELGISERDIHSEEDPKDRHISAEKLKEFIGKLSKSSDGWKVSSKTGK